MSSLHQDRTWTTEDGTVLQLAEMRQSHLENVLAMLRRNAEALKFRADLSLCFGPYPSGDAACDAFEDATARQFDMSASRWLEGTPLVRRLLVLVGEDPEPTPYVAPMPDGSPY